jgi:hypothetical protein
VQHTKTIPNGHNVCIPNDGKIDQNCQKIYQHLPLQGPPKFTQFGIYGLKIRPLATLKELRQATSVTNYFVNNQPKCSPYHCLSKLTHYFLCEKFSQKFGSFASKNTH